MWLHDRNDNKALKFNVHLPMLIVYGINLKRLRIRLNWVGVIPRWEAI